MTIEFFFDFSISVTKRDYVHMFVVRFITLFTVIIATITILTLFLLKVPVETSPALDSSNFQFHIISGRVCLDRRGKQ